MASQSPFFGKREGNESVLQRPTSPSTGLRSPQSPLSQAGAGQAAMNPAASPASRSASESPATPAPEAPAAAPAQGSEASGGARLTVGPNIKLKGVEITDCDTLFVEGTVEATMDSRLMQIAPSGAFKGSAEIDIAEIHGAFDGQLTVREKLVIHATGKVTGTVRYGKLVIEEGGQLSGEVQVGTAVARAVGGTAAKAEARMH
jgi:cytoskeletal protein CcmA (bactofilin family)